MNYKKPLKFSKNVCFPPRTPNYELWIPLVIGALFSVFILVILGVADDLKTFMAAKKAMLSVDEVRQQLIEIQKIELLSIESHDASPMLNKLDEVTGDNQLILARLKQNTAYNAKLSMGIARFLKVYHTWIDKKYILHSDRIMDSSHLFEHASADQLFLSAMTLLYQCEEHLHAEMNNGVKALDSIQWVLITLLVYTVIVATLYQRFALNTLKMQEKQLYITLQSIGDAVIITNLQGQVMSINPEAERLTDISRDAAIGQPLATIFKGVIMYEDEVLEKERVEDKVSVFSDDVLLTAIDGGRYRVINSGVPICDEAGQITGLVHIFKDVTQEHSLQNKVLQQAQRLKQTIDSVLDAIIVTDEKGAILEWNSRAEEVFGWSFEESISQFMHELIIPSEYRNAHLKEVQKLTDDAEPEWGKRIKLDGVHKEGHTFPIDIAMSSIQHAEGDRYFCAFIRDLTEIKAWHEELENHKKLLSESQRIARLGHWEFDHVNDQLLWSDELYTIFAFAPEETPCYETFMDFVHPEDRGHVERAYTDSIESKRPYNIIHRIILKDGSTKFVHQISETMYDENRQPVRTIGTVQEITNRIIADEKLWQAATTIEIHAGLIITDRKGAIIKVNHAYELMTGYAESELIGQTPRMLGSGRQDKQFYKCMWTSIKETGMWQGELWNKHKNGNLYAERLTVTAIKDEYDEISHYVGAAQDITDRKQAEAYIRHLAGYEE